MGPSAKIGDRAMRDLHAPPSDPIVGPIPFHELRHALLYWRRRLVADRLLELRSVRIGVRHVAGLQRQQLPDDLLHNAASTASIYSVSFTGELLPMLKTRNGAFEVAGSG